ncbi:MAG TPA: maleylpyruvate isomerase family mycothiol-dependent enzyme [Pseudonocardiaceae bacterium]
MDRNQVWQALDTERTGVADLLESLAPAAWNTPSLCAGWTVREVAAHLTLGPRFTYATAFLEFARARGSFDRMVHDTAVRRAAARTPEELVLDLRATVGSRRLAPGQQLMDALMDVLVHGQDIALPLDLRRPMPHAATVAALGHAWFRGRPFHARRTLAGFRLTATDSPFAVGKGEDVQGPSWALLLLVTGRPAALPHLTGDGIPALSRVCSPRTTRA